MKFSRRYFNILLTLLTLILGGTAAYIVWLSSRSHSGDEERFPFGVHENRQIVEIVGQTGKRTYVVEDSSGRLLFSIPLRNSVVDSRFRNGRLRFRNNESGREGYIDSLGFVNFSPEKPSDVIATQELSADTMTRQQTAPSQPRRMVGSSRFRDVDIQRMIANHPFGIEAKRVLSGQLEVADSLNRRKILSYCEHFRTAYTTKDIDFLRQVFSENALIIVGNTVRSGKSTTIASPERVSYAVRSKEVYLKNLMTVFDANRSIDVRFSDFHIMRHPTIGGIYGVSLRQRYSNDSYSDDGYLFLLWDFRDPSMPLIHVRTWQPESSIRHGEELIDISDFNLE